MGKKRVYVVWEPPDPGSPKNRKKPQKKKTDFCSAMRKMRENSGRSVRDTAKAAGISPFTLADVESGKRRTLPDGAIEEIAGYLGLSENDKGTLLALAADGRGIPDCLQARFTGKPKRRPVRGRCVETGGKSYVLIDNDAVIDNAKDEYKNNTYGNAYGKIQPTAADNGGLDGWDAYIREVAASREDYLF